MSDINMVPEFTESEGIQEVKQVPKETLEQETETPTELPAETIDEIVEEKPAEPVQAVLRDDTNSLEKQLLGLQEEKTKLLKEIQHLRGDRRELKKDELIRVDNKIDELQDVNPQDVQLIDKVLRSKGYLTKAESEKMFYDSVKQEKLNSFLEKYPEYKPENDPNDLNWSALTREVSIYAQPSDPKRWETILEKAHKDLAKPVSDQHVEIKRQQLKTAGVGSSGVQRSSSQKTLNPEQRSMYERGGWSEEEIKQIENRL